MEGAEAGISRPKSTNWPQALSLYQAVETMSSASRESQRYHLQKLEILCQMCVLGLQLAG